MRGQTPEGHRHASKAAENVADAIPLLNSAVDNSVPACRAALFVKPDR